MTHWLCFEDDNGWQTCHMHEAIRAEMSLKKKMSALLQQLMFLSSLASISFFNVSFLYKIIDLPGGHPSSERDFSIPFLPATPLSPSWLFKGFLS